MTDHEREDESDPHHESSGNSRRVESPADVTADSPYTLPGFFDALADGRLLGGVCAECGTVLLPPRPACYECGSRAVDIEEQPRTGEVVTWTEVRRAPPAFDHLAPFAVAIVELDSGGRLTGRVDAPSEAVAIGDPVRLTVREPSDAEREAALSYEADWPIHVFEPVRG